MVCKLASRFGGSPADWAELDPIWLHTMTAIAQEQDRNRKG